MRKAVEASRDRYLGWLVEACSIPSLAEQPAALAEMADWVEARLTALGAATEYLRAFDVDD